MRFKLAVAISVVIVAGGGAAAYALTSGPGGASPVAGSGAQVQHCVSQKNAQDVTTTDSRKCAKGTVQVSDPSPRATPSPSPKSRHRRRSSSHTPRSSSPTPTPTQQSSSPPSPAPAPSAPAPGGSYQCDFQTDTWSGDASSVGYSVQQLSADNGTTASFSVRLNANPGTTEVVGYPSDQCLIYSALPGSLTSSYDQTPPANSSGLDYEYAYDIWLTDASDATNANWNNDDELMIWTYVNGQVPAGSKVAKLSDGSAVWFDGSKGSNNSTISVVLPSNTTSGTVNIASIVSQLKALGYVPSSDNGILDVEYGIEAPYGGGNVFAVNGINVTG